MTTTVARKEAWLAAVAADPKLGRLSLRAAMVLYRYFNSRSGKAWPSLELISGELAADRRHLRRALSALVAAGHLYREWGGRGRGKTNAYYMDIKEGEIRPPKAEFRGANLVPKGGRNSPPNLKKNRRTGGSLRSPPASARATTHPSFSVSTGQDGPQRAYESETRTSEKQQTGTTLPAGFVIDDGLLRDAQRIAGWDEDRARQEFEKFRDYHEERRTHYRLWDNGWRNWCRQGAKIDLRDTSHKPSTGLASVAKGLNDFVNREKR
jgi:hypothetical protein